MTLSKKRLKLLKKLKSHNAMGHIKMTSKGRKTKQQKLRTLKSDKFRNVLKYEYLKLSKSRRIMDNNQAASSGSESMVDKVLSFRSVYKVPEQNLQIFFGGVRQNELEGKLEFIKNPITVSEKHLRRWQNQQKTKNKNTSQRMLRKQNSMGNRKNYDNIKLNNKFNRSKTQLSQIKLKDSGLKGQMQIIQGKIFDFNIYFFKISYN